MSGTTHPTPIVDAIAQLRDAFVALQLWERMGKTGGIEVLGALVVNINEATIELCDACPQWDQVEACIDTAYAAAGAWMATHGDQAAAFGLAELQAGVHQAEHVNELVSRGGLQS
jgi:hypothetical protein